jgi:hypothetical protein
MPCVITAELTATGCPISNATEFIVMSLPDVPTVSPLMII